MPYRQQQFTNNEIYHLMIKGIDDNLIFKDTDDYYRGIFSIYEFNNSNPVSIKERRKTRAKIKKIQAATFARGPSSGDSGVVLKEEDGRDKLVEILAFCFMPNHIHLLVRQIKDNGITKFMSKVGTGYGGYFNRKYERKGYVFQNRFVSVPVKSDNQLKIVFAYIHANPVSLFKPKWKETGIKDLDGVIEFIENYKWSSYLDCIGKNNFPSVTEREFMLKEMGGEQMSKNFVDDWIKYKGEVKEFPELALE